MRKINMTQHQFYGKIYGEKEMLGILRLIKRDVAEYNKMKGRVYHDID